ncbi:DUF4249 domain-containing protein [Marivirga harenae]|uniref:DUF4249 domain-containing protein n=1 Tax=Marivirga harenae TaxID=2010992 RepID=UPI0026E08293|nr:DUF4249 domain-containing protein [Marivirga harenae]WKV10659.1 DUF4249 domain-containing protein [Marivirga harenae]|tara:strand:+ start:44835 stop:45869 length:1035 start_codon:yes stop_codon:yes gene_type:complete
MLKKLFITAIVFTCFSACIDPLEVEIKNDGTSLVVYAEVTDQAERYTVQLSRTSNYESGLPEKETNAFVEVIDLDGNEYQFVEEKPGTYRSCPADFVGEVNGSYKLRISTQDEKVYESDFEKIIPTGKVESVYFNKEEVFELVDGRSRPIQGLKFYCDFSDTPDKDYYKLDWEGTFQFRSAPQDSLHEYCWITESSTMDINLYEDSFTNNSTKEAFELAFLEKGFRFVVDYSFQVQLKSINAGAYNFWRLVEQQYNNDGSIFSALPAQIGSNIKCVSNEDENVLGYFMTSAVSSQRVRVSPYDIDSPNSVISGCRPFRPNDPIQDYCYDCSLYPNSVAEQPDYW